MKWKAVLGILTAAGIGLVWYFSTGRSKYEIPVMVREGQVFVATSAGDLLLDTGSSVTLMDRKSAEGLGVEMLGNRFVLKGLSGTEKDAEMGTIEKFEIEGWGGIRGPLEVGVIEGLEKRLGMQGILGIDVFGGEVFELDLGKGVVRILRNRPFGFDCKTVSVVMEWDLPMVEVNVEGADDFRAVFDTGFGGWLLLTDEAWKNVEGIEEQAQSEGPLESGVLGAMRYDWGRAGRDITVGNVTVERMPINRLSSGEINIVGFSLLRLTRVALDCRGGKAIFRTNSVFGNKIWVSMGAE